MVASFKDKMMNEGKDNLGRAVDDLDEILEAVHAVDEERGGRLLKHIETYTVPEVKIIISFPFIIMSYS